MRYAMIMAGGAGTRLWPMSRKDMPKQLIKFIQPKASAGGGGPKSLLEIAADRLEGVVPAEKRFICTSEGFRSVIRRDLPAFTDERIMGEPVGREHWIGGAVDLPELRRGRTCCERGTARGPEREPSRFAAGTMGGGWAGFLRVRRGRTCCERGPLAVRRESRRRRLNLRYAEVAAWNSATFGYSSC